MSRSHRGRRGKHVLGLVGGAALVAFLAGCGSSGQGNSNSATPPRSGPAASHRVVLTTETSPSGPLTDNFNPFSPTNAFSIGGENMIYEPLFQIDPLAPKRIYNWLGTSYAWSDGGKALTIKLRHGVTWSDGKPFTSADVVFTFQLLKRYPSTNTQAITYSTVKAVGPYEVRLTFSAPDYVNFPYIAGQVIAPRHIWSKVNPVSAQNTHPVGTGPFVLSSFTPQGFLLTRNPHYWQKGKPKIYGLRYVVHDSNSSANLAMEQGQLDWAGNFVSDIKSAYLARSPNYHYWFPVVSYWYLIPNLTVYPLNLSDVRLAISDVINRPFISKVSEQGEQPPATSPLGLTPGLSSYVAPQYRHLRYRVDKAKALQLLAAAGLKRHGQWFVGKNGKPISLTIIEPSGWSDILDDDNIIASELKTIGIQARVEPQSLAAWTGDTHDGKFDLTLSGEGSSVSPYINYFNMLSWSLSAPVGKNASSDIGRWHDSQTASLLARYASTDNRATQQRALDGLEQIMVNKAPLIPVVGGVAWSEYSTKDVVGWANASDPYWTDQPGSEVTALHVRPRG